MEGIKVAVRKNRSLNSRICQFFFRFFVIFGPSEFGHKDKHLSFSTDSSCSTRIVLLESLMGEFFPVVVEKCDFENFELIFGNIFEHFGQLMDRKKLKNERNMGSSCGARLSAKASRKAVKLCPHHLIETWLIRGLDTNLSF